MSDCAPSLFDVPPASHQSATSTKAAISVRASAVQRQRLLIMRALMQDPATRQELTARTAVDGDSLRPRVWELMRAKPPLVEVIGLRPTDSGRASELLALTAAGRAWEQQHRSE